ncbi:MAG: sigma-70 family RNA polymerase sigma factor [Chloroflexi bacterium]|nr:sigma-70 family RNA polymerase sigma factor [Chloroflexota bacterium]
MVTEHDDLLLQKLAKGDNSAFEGLFLRHYSQVYRVLFGLMGRHEGAEDLAQETFLELLKRSPQIAQGSTLAAWLCRVALNKGYNALRSERRATERAEQMEPPDHSVDPFAVLLRAEENARVRQVLAHLSERQSKLLLLRYAGLSYNELASALEIAPTSVGTLLARAEKAFLDTYKLMEPLEFIDSLEKRKR